MEGDSEGTLLNILYPSRELNGDAITFRFGNGLTVTTETLRKNDPQRILPLGGPQRKIMGFMLKHPEMIRGKEVLEPFAGSGALGMMALKVGARTADFVDLNSRAAQFQRGNARLSGLDAGCVRCFTEDVATFRSDRKYDWIFANPPFVPTPDGIPGTLTSNGGPDGNRFARILLGRLEHLLKPSGEMLIYLLQIVRDGRPLIADLACEYLKRRSLELTSTQAQPIPFDVYLQAYLDLFGTSEPEIREWSARLARTHGDRLFLNHYVAHVGPESEAPGDCRIASNLERKYGRGLLTRRDPRELSLARISENLLNPSS